MHLTRDMTNKFGQPSAAANVTWVIRIQWKVEPRSFFENNKYQSPHPNRAVNV
jgi:hypothetical protein